MKDNPGGQDPERLILRMKFSIFFYYPSISSSWIHILIKTSRMSDTYK